MSDSVKTKKRRSAEERVAEIDAKIESHKSAIQKLEQRKNEILNPKPRLTKAQKTKIIINKAKESGMSPEEIAKRLEINFE